MTEAEWLGAVRKLSNEVPELVPFLLFEVQQDWDHRDFYEALSTVARNLGAPYAPLEVDVPRKFAKRFGLKRRD